MKNRVHQADLANWTYLYETEKGYVLEVSYLTPNNEKHVYGVTFLLVFPLLIFYGIFAAAVYQAVSEWKENTVFIVALCVGAYYMTKWTRFLIMRILERFVERKIRVNFEGGEIWWREDGRGEVLRCEAGSPRDFVVEEHPKAVYERLKLQELAARPAGKPVWAHPFYEHSRQVVVRSGPARGRRLLVASIAADPNGHQAAELREALEFADNLGQKRSGENPDGIRGGLN